MSIHSIRLNGPWHFQSAHSFESAEGFAISGDTTDAIRYKMPVDWEVLLENSIEDYFTLYRAFNMPNGIEENETISVRFGQLDLNCKVYLNQQLLPLQKDIDEGSFDVTEKILGHNTIWVVWQRTPNTNRALSGPFTECVLEFNSGDDSKINLQNSGDLHAELEN